MWKRLHSLPYYLLYTHSENIYVSLTDYVKIWTVQFTMEEFTSCLKKSNPFLNIDSDELVTNGIQMLNQAETLKSSVSNVNHNLELFLSKSFGYPLKITMLLKLRSHEHFFQNVTFPLLKTIHDLHNSEHKLRQLLKHKDKEIEEYKAEAGEVCLRYLKTKPYNDERHMDIHTSYNKLFGSMGIPDSLILKSVDIPEEKPMNQDINIKIEPLSQDLQHVKTEIVEVSEENIKIEPCTSSSTTITKKRRIKLNI